MRDNYIFHRMIASVIKRIKQIIQRQPQQPEQQLDQPEDTEDTLIRVDIVKFQHYNNIVCNRSELGCSFYNMMHYIMNTSIRENVYKLNSEQLHDVDGAYLTRNQIEFIAESIYLMIDMHIPQYRDSVSPLLEFDRQTSNMVIYFEFSLFLMKYTNDEALLKEKILNVINMLKEHETEAIAIGEDRMLDKLDTMKGQIGQIIKDLDINIPNNIMKDLLRSERIIYILTVERALEDKVSTNVNQVICNSDLNRYLMGFIN